MYLYSEFDMATNLFLSINTSRKLGGKLKVTNLKRRTGNKFIDLSGNQAWNAFSRLLILIASFFFNSNALGLLFLQINKYFFKNLLLF